MRYPTHLRNFCSVLRPLVTPGRRNRNVNLDELRWFRPDLDCEPLQAQGILRNLQLDETMCVVSSRTLRSPDLLCERSCEVQGYLASRCRDSQGNRRGLLIHDCSSVAGGPVSRFARLV